MRSSVQDISAVCFGAGVLVRALPAQVLHEAGHYGSLALVQRHRDGRYDGFRQTGGYTIRMVDLNGQAEQCFNRAVGAWLILDEHWDELLALTASKRLSVIITNTGESGWDVAEADLRPPARLVSALPRPGFFLGQLLVCLLGRFQSGAPPVIVQPAELDVNNAPLLQLRVLRLAQHWLEDRWRDYDLFRRYLTERVCWCRSLVDRLTPEANITPAPQEAHPDLTTERFALYAVERQPGMAPFCRHPAVITTEDSRPWAWRKIVLINAWRSLIVEQALALGISTETPFCELMEDRRLRPFIDCVLNEELLPAVADTPAAYSFALTARRRFAVPEVSSRMIKIMGGSMEGHRRKLASRCAQTLYRCSVKGLGTPPKIAETLRLAGMDASLLLDQEFQKSASLEEEFAAV